MLNCHLSEHIPDQPEAILSSTTLTLSRREVFRLVGALCLTSPMSLSFLGCNKSNPEPDLSLVDPPTLAQLRDLIRSSSDHLQARAEEVVATKDVTRIAEFVRDHIAVLPSFYDRDDGRYASRWGVNGTLRAGAGTLRDRAELLVAMLGAAGIAATVREMPMPSRMNADRLYRPRPHEFSIDEAKLTAMVKAIQKKEASEQTTNVPEQAETGKKTVTAVEDVDPASLVNDAAKTITSAIAGKMTNLEKAELPVPPQIPVVTIEGDPSKVLVSLASMAVENGDVNKLPLLTNYDRPKIEFSVTAFLNPRLGGGSPRVVELVKSSWPVEDVVGHQVQVLFGPPQGAKALLAAPLSSYPVRVPIIRVQPRPSGEFDARKVIFGKKVPTPHPTTAASAPSAETAEPSLLTTGSLFTIDGEILAEVTPEPLKGNQRLLVLDDTQAQAETKRVTKLKATVNAASFPEIEVALSVTDAKGASVDGLGMSAFAVTEGTQPCRPILVANRQIDQRPRILVLYDGSGSMDEAFGSKENRQAFNKLLAQTLTDAAVVQPLDVRVVGFGGGSQPWGWKQPSVEQLTKDMELFSFSNLWTSFTNGALDDGPAAVIIVSDYDAEDAGQAAAAKLRLTRAQIPILAITPGKVKEEVLSDLLTVSGAQRFAVTDPKLKTALREAVAKATTTKRAYSYRFHYKAELEGPNPRPVHIALTNHSQIRTSVTYQVPASESRVPPASVAGLYLTVSVGGQRERRHLGGIRFNERGDTKDDPNNAALIAEARNALNGMVTVTVEPGSPTMGAVLEDVVTSFQSFEPLLDKKSTKDEEQAFMKTAAGLYRYPVDLAQILTPPPNSMRDASVVPKGLRILISTEQPTEKGLLSRMDIPPELNCMRIAGGDASRISSVVQQSLWLSVNEALAYDSAAFKELQGRPLQFLKATESLPDFIIKGYSPEQAVSLSRVSNQYSYYHRLVPTDGGSVAMWIVDPTSGTVFAVDETGRGGGSDCLSGILEGFTDILKALGVLLFAAFFGCERNVKSAAQAIRCMGIGTAAVYEAAASALVEYIHHPPNLGWRGVELGAELGLIGLHVRGVGHLQGSIDPFTKVFTEPHAGSTVVIVVMCIVFVGLNIHYLMERVHHCDPGRPGVPSEHRAPRGRQRLS
ncbi:hypothetical protein [Nitrospira sp. BLG_1]|uniref:hypothetical protein n=1 Tax=Nitrospira sp. BLG_1 TaxID=3395883 RepID=UPI0039BC858A